MRSLRSRLILSHILPILILVPLMALVLIYFLETQVLIAGLEDDLLRQARQWLRARNPPPGEIQGDPR